MAERDTFVAVSDGDQLNQGFFRGVYYGRGRMLQLYTGTGFDTSQASTGTDTDTHELDAITSANLVDVDYIEIGITATHVCNTTSGSTLKTEFKIEAKEVGGAYGDTLATTTILGVGSGGSDSTEVDSTTTFKWIHTLTAGQKTNGVQFQITSNSVVGASAGTATVTNKQVLLKSLSD